MSRMIQEPSREIPVIAEAEVVVLGGGPAGIAAATAAARTGARTLLLERYGFLGGMGTAAMVTNFCGLHADIDGEITQIIHGVVDDLQDRLRKLDALAEPHIVQGPDGLRTAAQVYDTAALKAAADDLLLSSNVEIRFHTVAVGAVMDERRIDAVVIETKSGRQAVRGQVFIDCSGDADLAAWSGAPFEIGSDDGFIAYPTLMFRLAAVDDERAKTEGKPALNRLMEEAARSGDYDLPRKAGIMGVQHHSGEWRANLTQISRNGAPINGADADDLTFSEIEGRRQVAEYLRFLKDRVPGFENCYLLETAPQIGIRETRRIVGEFQLSGDDILGCRDFDDTIGANGWPLETHVLGGMKFVFLAGRGYHQIPFRCALPQKVDNLLVAGRCASTTPEGQASLRVSGPCFALGQAVGTAAALSAAEGVLPSALDIPRLQRQLTADGVWLG